MLPWGRGTIAMRKTPLTFFLVKPSYNAEAMFKTYDLFVYGDIHYIPN
jgi:hypothetical protein